MHISELAAHHVENPREVVSQGDPVNVLVLEIDGERRRLSLSLKRVEEGAEPLPRPDGAPSVHDTPTPDLKLSEEAFPQSAAAPELDDRRRVRRSRRRSRMPSPRPTVELEAEVEAEVEAEARSESRGRGRAEVEEELEAEVARSRRSSRPR